VGVDRLAVVEHDVTKQDPQSLDVTEATSDRKGLGEQRKHIQALENSVDQRKAADPAGPQRKGRKILTPSHSISIITDRYIDVKRFRCLPPTLR